MTKLINHMVVQSLQEYDEANLNKYFNPHGFYPMVLLASIVINQPIQNITGKANLYTRYRKAITKCQIEEIQQLKTKILIGIDKDRGGIINQFISIESEKDYTEGKILPIYNKKSLGAQSYVYD